MEHTLALIERSHQGDKEARDTIFKENAGLIYSVAKRFLGRGVDMEDLFQFFPRAVNFEAVLLQASAYFQDSIIP